MTEPTDDEIAALRSEFGITSNGRGIKEFTQVRDFARAVLAKWGVLRAEKIVIPTDTMEQEFQKHYRRGYEAGKKATTQQPTQAQVVNQANRPFIVRLAEDFAEECVTAGYVTTKAASYGRLMDEALSTKAQAGAVPLTDREIELIDGMIQVQLDHASRCDAIANRSMADKQKGWDMERVALLQKFKAHGIKGGQHGTDN